LEFAGPTAAILGGPWEARYEDGMEDTFHSNSRRAVSDAFFATLGKAT
jgi:hypothetical protein